MKTKKKKTSAINLSRLEDLRKDTFMSVFNFEILLHFNLRTVHFSTLWNVIDLATLKGKALRRKDSHVHCKGLWKKKTRESKAQAEGLLQ